MSESKSRADWLDRPDILAVTFHPRREAPARPAGFEPLEMPVDGDVTIGGRFYAAGTAAPTILFFHGNGEIVADYHAIARMYVARDINFMPVDYRGYGRSTGTPTISSMLRDARHIYRFARQWLEDRRYQGPLVVMGRSLGSASALEVISAHGDIDGLILDSGFAHVVPLLRRLGASIPDPAPEDTLAQLDKIGTYDGPTLIIHGTQDMIIPITDGQALYAASPSAKKTFLPIQGAGHNNILSLAPEQYFDAVAALAHTNVE